MSQVPAGRSRPGNPGLTRVGSIAGIDVTVSRSWFLIVGLIAVLVAPIMQQVSPDLGGLAYVAGAAFAVLLYVSTLLHEIAHALAALGFGMRVHSINLNFFGGATAVEDEGNTPWREFAVAVVGPLTSLAVAGLGWLTYRNIDDGLVGFTIGALAVSNFAIGLLNLVPGLPLDGGRVLLAGVWGVSGNRQLATMVAGWAGRVAAIAALGYPFLMQRWGWHLDVSDFFFAAMVSGFLWVGASHAIEVAGVRARLPQLTASILARPAIGVAGELPVAEAVRRARAANVTALIIVDGQGTAVGLVSEQSVWAIPEDRRAWISCAQVARTIEPGLIVPSTATGEVLLERLQSTPATEYLVLTPEHAVLGVLVSSDVSKALRRS
jgi:Zn-dependent protease